jgi:hypothetical protein
MVIIPIPVELGTFAIGFDGIVFPTPKKYPNCDRFPDAGRIYGDLSNIKSTIQPRFNFGKRNIQATSFMS